MSFSLYMAKVPEEQPRAIYLGCKHLVVESGILGVDNDGSLRTDIVRIQPGSKTFVRLLAYLQGAYAASSRMEDQSERDSIKLLLDALRDRDEYPNGVDLWIGDYNDFDHLPEDDD